MGDSCEVYDVFKKLGFDSSNQWIIMDLEPFQNFFTWFADNITEDNILTEHEILQTSELKSGNKFINSEELDLKLKLLSQDYPQILEYSDDDVLKMIRETQQNKKILDMYENLGLRMNRTKTNLNGELLDLEANIRELENEEKNLINKPFEEAKALQELQRENKKLCIELNDCFMKSHSPPLFTHQLPMEQYFLQSEIFMQYLNLFLQNNFKFEDFMTSDFIEDTLSKDDIVLDNLKHLFFNYNEMCIKERAEVIAIKLMIEELKPSRNHAVNLNELKKETEELKIVNRRYYDTTFETLMTDLRNQLQQYSELQISKIISLNTQEKLDRAKQRLENIKFLSGILSAGLCVAEIIWVLMQLDSEKIKNIFDNTEQLQLEMLQCAKRIDGLKQLQIQSSTELSEQFSNGLVELFGKHLEIKFASNSPKTFLFEYDKFLRSHQNTLKNIMLKKNYEGSMEILEDLNKLELIVMPYVFDSPVKKPMFENMNFFKSISKVRFMNDDTEKKFRELRFDFQKKFSEKMGTDTLWSNKQLLWIWFLTQPEKVLSAIEEVRIAAAKKPSNVKTLGGLRRM